MPAAQNDVAIKSSTTSTSTTTRDDLDAVPTDSPAGGEVDGIPPAHLEEEEPRRDGDGADGGDVGATAKLESGLSEDPNVPEKSSSSNTATILMAVNANPGTRSCNIEIGKDKIDQDATEPHPMNPLALFLLSRPGRGRGVFAPCDIPAGTLIEESPVLLLSKQEWEMGRLDDTILGEYGFCWSNGGMGIGLGLASLFNHSPSPNVNYIRQLSSSTIRFLTSRRVLRGEELCICYSADDSKLWFTPSEQVFTGNGPPSPSVSGQPVSLPGTKRTSMDGTPNSEDAESASISELAVDFFAPDPEDMTAKQARVEARKARKAKVLVEGRSAREGRVQKFFAKQAVKASADNLNMSSRPGTHVERPAENEIEVSRKAALIDLGESVTPNNRSRSSTPVTRTSTPASDYPAYPSLPEGLMPNLPAPLHSDTPARVKETGPAELVPELDWLDGDVDDGEGSVANAVGASEMQDGRISLRLDGLDVVKVLGELERQEEEEGQAMHIWAADVLDPKMTRLILEFTKDVCAADPRMRHLKRVANRRNFNGEPDHTLIAICAADSITLTSLQSSLTSYHSTLSTLSLFLASVPAGPARSPQELKLKNASWPVIYSPTPPRTLDASSWSPPRKSWVLSGLRRVLSDALSAKSKGELPIAVFATSPPESLWPVNDAFIPPTPLLRAGARDTRLSQSHPLRHAAFNCIAEIASLRTRLPFSEMQPTRNGADYLLTSLSLFITHEPCVMCCMALLHSRVREVFYVFPRKRGGGFESAFGVHGRKDLNHRYDVWRYTGGLNRELEEALRIDEEIAL